MRLYILKMIRSGGKSTPVYMCVCVCVCVCLSVGLPISGDGGAGGLRRGVQ